jgi:hypothetical protein
MEVLIGMAVQMNLNWGGLQLHIWLGDRSQHILFKPTEKQTHLCTPRKDALTVPRSAETFQVALLNHQVLKEVKKSLFILLTFSCLLILRNLNGNLRPDKVWPLNPDVCHLLSLWALEHCVLHRSPAQANTTVSTYAPPAPTPNLTCLLLGSSLSMAFFFCGMVWWCWGLNSGPHDCQAGTRHLKHSTNPVAYFFFKSSKQGWVGVRARCFWKFLLQKLVDLGWGCVPIDMPFKAKCM